MMSLVSNITIPFSCSVPLSKQHPYGTIPLPRRLSNSVVMMQQQQQQQQQRCGFPWSAASASPRHFPSLPFPPYFLKLDQGEEYNDEQGIQEELDFFAKEKEKVNQSFDLLDYLEGCGFIKHDSSVDEVLEKIPKEMLALVDETPIKVDIKLEIKRLKAINRTHLYREYCLYLPRFEYIKSHSDVSEVLKLLEHDVRFQEQKVTNVGPFRLKRGLEYYISCLDCHQKVHPFYEDNVKSKVNSKLSFLKQRFLFILDHPLSNFVFKQRYEGQTIPDDPIQELTEFYDAARRLEVL